MQTTPPETGCQSRCSRRQAVSTLMRGVAVLAVGSGALAEVRPRSALVIGNAAYSVGPLRNSVNDARLVSQSLRSIAYEVEHHEDLALQEMLRVLDQWISRSAPTDMRLLYFAGHGAQFRGQNFLVPVDAALQEESDLLRYTVNASDVIDHIARTGQGVNIVILDACRNGLPPLEPTRARNKTREIRIGRTPGGLASQPSPKGTLVAYAAAPGAVALDGSQSNGAYARYLAAEMLVPGTTVESVFKRVRSAVARETRNLQVPWETSSLVGEVCIRPGVRGECGLPSGPASGAGIDVGASR
ncbi:MAG: caspase domain-containing protein [Leptothrix sp. (in: b-proteobacteria)]